MRALREMPTTVVAGRELGVYFRSPLAYIFMFIFTMAACGLALLPEFELFGRSFGGLLGQQEANLIPFFDTLPFLMAFFAPAIAMKLWADERKKGTIELLFTLPMSARQVVFGKFLGAWAVLVVGLLFTLPLAFVVETIGDLHWPMLLGGYLGAILLAGAFAAIGCAASALTENSIVALILGVSFCGVLLGLNLLPFEAGSFLSSLQGAGVLEHFQPLAQGKVALTNILYFSSLMVGCYIVNLFFLETR